MFSYDTVVMDIPIIEDQSTDHSDDRAAITALIADIERGFNSNDADLLTSPLAGNASTVNVVGMHTADRDAALVTSRAGLGGPLRNEIADYELADLLFIRPDVAVAHKHAWAIENGRRTTTAPAMIALYVLVKHDGRWWVVARQNTATQTSQ